MQLTLVAPLASLAARPDDPVEASDGWVVRALMPADADELGRLYFAAYPPGVAGETVEEATADIGAAIAGEYGALRLDASLVATTGEAIVGAVLVVDDPPWDDVPPGPFVIDLFTGSAHRGRGIARDLLTRATRACAVARCVRIMLRVESTNDPAVSLYRSLGFTTRS